LLSRLLLSRYVLVWLQSVSVPDQIFAFLLLRDELNLWQRGNTARAEYCLGKPRNRLRIQCNQTSYRLEVFLYPPRVHTNTIVEAKVQPDELPHTYRSEYRLAQAKVREFLR